jgi:hypothetical protein
VAGINAPRDTLTPGFTVWDLRGYWRTNDRWLFVSGVENFTNKNYREHLDFRFPDGTGMYQPGVSFYFGSELNYCGEPRSPPATRHGSIGRCRAQRHCIVPTADGQRRCGRRETRS